MAYKYLNDDGLKAYTKKVKSALKDLHTPIAISTENTTESMAQNVRNIADFVAKAKAAGIADVNGMAVTCLIDDDYSGVGYLYKSGDNSFAQGVLIKDDLADNMCFIVYEDGQYEERGLIVSDNGIAKVNSSMLTQGARRPIIFTPKTTEVDEETYQKLMSDDVDVVFKTSPNLDANICILTYKTYEDDLILYFSCFSIESGTVNYTYLYAYEVIITKTNPHTCSIVEHINDVLDTFISDGGFINKSVLSPVLQEIDLTGTDAERKAKLDKFESGWKDLTGASDLTGARFVGKIQYDGSQGTYVHCGIFVWLPIANGYYAIMSNGRDGGSESSPVVSRVIPSNGAIYITHLFSHLEPVEIFFDNTAEKKKKNLDNLNAYKANLEQLGVDTSISFQVVFQNGNGEYFGNLYYSGGGSTYIGLIFTVDDNSVGWMRIKADGEVVFVDLASKDDIAGYLDQSILTPVPLTTTTSTNKTQLDLFLSKVPNAQVMYVTYKGVYAGTLHKINGSWYGVLVGESNTLAGQLSIKLQADGTIVEGTA